MGFKRNIAGNSGLYGLEVRNDKKDSKKGEKMNDCSFDIGFYGGIIGGILIYIAIILTKRKCSLSQTTRHC